MINYYEYLDIKLKNDFIKKEYKKKYTKKEFKVRKFKQFEKSLKRR